jgi:hypothetical protein
MQHGTTMKIRIRNFMEQSPSVGSDSLLDAKNFFCFKKLRGSSPRSGDSATGPCSVSRESPSQLNVLSLMETSYIRTLRS